MPYRLLCNETASGSTSHSTSRQGISKMGSKLARKKRKRQALPQSQSGGIVRAALAVALTIQVNCTCPLAQPVEKSVDWDWSLRSHLVRGRYDREAGRHSA